MMIHGYRVGCSECEARAAAVESAELYDQLVAAGRSRRERDQASEGQVQTPPKLSAPNACKACGGQWPYYVWADREDKGKCIECNPRHKTSTGGESHMPVEPQAASADLVGRGERPVGVGLRKPYGPQDEASPAGDAETPRSSPSSCPDPFFENDPRMAVSMLRHMLQLARIFIEGKALTPDPMVLAAVDLVLSDTRKHDALTPPK